MNPTNDISLPLAGAQGDCGCHAHEATSDCGCGSHESHAVARRGATWWRSLGERDEDAQASAFAAREFSMASDVLEGDDRRTFIKLMGAGFALAGLGLTGCRRWPESKIVPNASQPANRTPGIAVSYSTAVDLMGVGYGLIATSYDGRPIKLDGNPAHPYWGGASTSWMQARVLELYDPDRSRQVFNKGAASDYASFAKWLRANADRLAATQGAGLAVLTQANSGPAFADMIARVKAAYPQASVTVWEALSPGASREGLATAMGQSMTAIHDLSQAQVIVSLDCDFLGTTLDSTRSTQQWAAGRRIRNQDPAKQTQSRTYVAEAGLTVTGMNADQRFALRRMDIPLLAALIAQGVGAGGGNASLKAAIDAAAANPACKNLLDEHGAAALAKLIDDLKSSGGNAVVLCGEGQPPALHALTAAINAAIGATGKTVRYAPTAQLPSVVQFKALVDQMNAGRVDTLLILGANPVYDAPADLQFSAAMAKVPNVARVAYYRDETSLDKSCAWHVPACHFLESWGDAASPDGTVSIQQPLILPLIDAAQGGRSPIEILAELLGQDPRDGYAIVRRAHMASSGLAGAAFESQWRTWLDQGFIAKPAATPPSASLNSDAIAKSFAALAPAMGGARGSEIELCFAPDARVLDGRFANLGWLQELPDPVTKITWDNALLLSVPTMQRLGLRSGDMVKVSAGGASLQCAAWAVPGAADDSGTLSLGCGRQGDAAGRIAADAGFNAYPLRTTGGMALVRAATVQPTGQRYEFAHTQDHGAVDAMIASVPADGIQTRLPTLVRENTLNQYRSDPGFAGELVHTPHRLSLWQENNLDGAQFRWAVSIDLSTCTGCSACVTACQAENNIPIVGKDQVKRGREMFWIRIDRYFRGADAAKPDGFAIQPVACMHCENAPCEQVCPVAATVHDSDGLNSMVYNRCIGTRYCSNNCPYKVRRFNFFDYQRRDPIREQTGPLAVKPEYYVETGPDAWVRMQMNPEVTVRMRGVMEKCSFCVQRIAAAKIKYKNQWVKAGGASTGAAHYAIPDGAIVTACQQACPAGAIVFGDLNDPASAVSKLHASKLSYGMLEELNVKPRVKYMARIRNPAIEPAPSTQGHDHGGHEQARRDAAREARS
jgi:molybdopterin-containing oxidoreductase family iron-sulfur binding subunit